MWGVHSDHSVIQHHHVAGPLPECYSHHDPPKRLNWLPISLPHKSLCSRCLQRLDSICFVFFLLVNRWLFFQESHLPLCSFQTAVTCGIAEVFIFPFMMLFMSVFSSAQILLDTSTDHIFFNAQILMDTRSHHIFFSAQILLDTITHHIRSKTEEKMPATDVSCGIGLIGGLMSTYSSKNVRFISWNLLKDNLSKCLLMLSYFLISGPVGEEAQPSQITGGLS